MTALMEFHWNSQSFRQLLCNHSKIHTQQFQLAAAKENQLFDRMLLYDFVRRFLDLGQLISCYPINFLQTQETQLSLFL